MAEKDLEHGFERIHGVMQNTQPTADAVFSMPTNPMPAGTQAANTNYGRDTNTLDRSMPLSMGGTNEQVVGPDFGEGTWLGEWGKGR